MQFIKYEELKKIEKENPKAAKKAQGKSMILAATIATVLVALAPMMEKNALFIGLFFGILSFFAIYSTTMVEIKLLKELGRNEDDAEKEANNA